MLALAHPIIPYITFVPWSTKSYDGGRLFRRARHVDYLVRGDVHPQRAPSISKIYGTWTAVSRSAMKMPCIFDPAAPSRRQRARGCYALPVGCQSGGGAFPAALCVGCALADTSPMMHCSSTWRFYYGEAIFNIRKMHHMFWVDADFGAVVGVQFHSSATSLRAFSGGSHPACTGTLATGIVSMRLRRGYVCI